MDGPGEADPRPDDALQHRQPGRRLAHVRNATAGRRPRAVLLDVGRLARATSEDDLIEMVDQFLRRAEPDAWARAQPRGSAPHVEPTTVHSFPRSRTSSAATRLATQ